MEGRPPHRRIASAKWNMESPCPKREVGLPQQNNPHNPKKQTNQNAIHNTKHTITRNTKQKTLAYYIHIHNKSY